MQLTQELLERAEAKLTKAQSALESQPDNKRLKMSVEVLQDEVEAIRRLLLKSEHAVTLSELTRQ